ncbi:phytanoyl-CoA dioxygenase family protein [Methylogaea oryzae]|uniref:phytanoyl-CoA dioxygenase family protein n=1 Tax=Methylogaea oryzae TaxID=1295382 RepID=UPI000A8718D1
MTVSSMEVGGLGVRHLKRYWHRLTQRNGQGGEDDRPLDEMLLHGLGLGIVEPAQYLFHQRPSFAEFEAWVAGKIGGAPPSALVERLNEAVRRHGEAPPRTYPVAGAAVDDPVLSEADLAFWREHGYVVLRQAVSREDCRAAEQAVWDFLGMDAADPASWYDGEHTFWVPLFRHPALDKNRASPRIRKAFEQLWGTADLWPTVDRCSLNRPECGGMDTSGPSRLHWDVSIALPIPFGIQGLLYLSDAGAERGAFRCVPGFHHRMAQWLGKLPPEQNPRDLDLEALGPLPVAGAAGDFVLWHHALPHGSGRNTADRPRVVQYIKWFPQDHGVHPLWR